SVVSAIYSHGDVCLSWGRWGEFVGSRGSGEDGWKVGEVVLWGMAGKPISGVNSISFKRGGDEAGLGFLQS
nr:hypothetical protein [Tanacetum cinerariifolium]